VEVACIGGRPLVVQTASSRRINSLVPPILHTQVLHILEHIYVIGFSIRGSLHHFLPGIVDVLLQEPGTSWPAETTLLEGGFILVFQLNLD